VQIGLNILLFMLILHGLPDWDINGQPIWFFGCNLLFSLF